MKQIKTIFTFKNKRNRHLITPCCNKSNKDGKFINFNELPEYFGQCFACDSTTLPPKLYEDEKSRKFSWNESLKQFEPFDSLDFYTTPKNTHRISTKNQNPTVQQFIPEKIIWKYFKIKPENNLLIYLRNRYGNEKVEKAKEMYAIGSCNEGGAMFWSINKQLNVQKLKTSFYDINGKKTNRFNQPYTNENGYYSCLFGEHLLVEKLKYNKNQIIVLVEGEKCAIVGSILLPKYTWISYGGINGLTNNKVKCLIGYKILIIPDMSRRAVEVINSKIPYLRNLGIDAQIWDMTEGKSDEQLKLDGVYNDDLEDVFRRLNLCS
nr:DUF6371 domain-containing protein [uncultured Psychroserpens sp.]